ncbi:MAG: heme ABC transporter permease [Gammaproteobacteria bacterium]|nr:heme ABC transporter permease [Gammaproteobacteria bacterium]
MLSTLYKFAAPKNFYTFCTASLPWVMVLFGITLSYGLVGGLYLAPADYQQGEAFRIIYVHVPSAVLSLGVYLFMAIMASIGLIWRVKLAEVLFAVSAPIGASFTFLALVTGALWGLPTWGTWWLWDARLTSELILLFLYVGVIALQSAIVEKEKAIRASSILVIVGVVDLPIIHYSVNWWNTLHQKASILKFNSPSIAPSMLYPLLAMILAFLLFYIIVLLLRARNELLLREHRSHWVKNILATENNASFNR